MKYRVVYEVLYAATIEVGDGEQIDDVVSDIEIPEGGKHDSSYVADSFQVRFVERIKPLPDIHS